MPSADLLNMYKAIIRPILEYAVPIWHSSLPGYLARNLEQVQRTALRTVCGDGSQGSSGGCSPIHSARSSFVPHLPIRKAFAGTSAGCRA